MKHFFSKISKNKLDIFLILVIMIISVLVRFPSLHLDGISNIYTDDNQNIYLNEMDSYYFAKKVSIFAGERSGEISMTDNLMPFLVGIACYFIRLIFNIPSIYVITYIGPIFFSFSIPIFYLFIKKRTNRIGGIISGFLTATMPCIVPSTIFGRFDTDIFLVIMPISFIFLLIKTLEETNKKMKLKNFTLTVLIFILLYLTWHSASIYYYLSIAFLAISYICFLYFKRHNIKEFIKSLQSKIILIFIGVFTTIHLIALKTGIIFSFLEQALNGFGIYLNRGPSKLTGSYPPISFISEQKHINLFSNENWFLNSLDASNSEIVSKIGGFFALFMSLIAIFYLVFLLYKIAKIKDSKNPPATTLIFYNKRKSLIYIGLCLILWYIGSFMSLMFGSRYTKIFAIPLIISLGIIFGLLFEYLKNKQRRYIFILVVLAITTVAPSCFSFKTASALPGVDDSMFEAAKYINNNLNKDDSMVISWWDYGYFYKYKDLETLVDGGFHEEWLLYFVGKAFMSTNSELSAGYFRLASNVERNQETKTKLEELADNSLPKMDKILNDILPLNEPEARTILKKNYSFTEEKANELLKITHTKNRKITIIITGDMIAKTEAIGFYGNYDFQTGESKHKNNKAGQEWVITELDDMFSSTLLRLYSVNNDIGPFHYEATFEDPEGYLGPVIWTIK